VAEHREPGHIDEFDLGKVLLARKGDRLAFEALFVKYRERIYHVANKYVHNEDDAMEVVQDVFIKAYRALDTFKEDANFYTWLCRIAINKSIDHLRARRGRKEVSYDALEGADGKSPEIGRSTESAPEEKAHMKELERAVAEAVDSLPDYHKEVIILNAREDLSYKEIAETLGISTGTVMSRLHYARKALREKLRGFLTEEFEKEKKKA
jgi:RNA polymerase sigma-70 factor (ECF subfamily)